MIFSSTIFVLVYLPIVLLFHSLLYLKYKSKPSYKILNIFIFFVSIVFYSWGEPKYILLLLFSTVFNFYIAIYLASRPSKKVRIRILFIGIIINLLLLAYYKYAGFFADYFLTPDRFYLFSQEVSIRSLRKIALPIGISFYTFQGISYLIDVYRKVVVPSSKLTDFGCYLTMFSQLIAGPIVRYASIESQLINRILTFDCLWSGATRFIYGLSKKVLIADTLGRIADAAFNIPSGELPATAAWLGIVCYTFQIYYDFSGYSDMAIGIGLMLGFTFPENFNYPYISRSIREFWRRWHMTLSSWFRDYLYIPLGGNRNGKYRTAINLLIVFSLCGFWHGASLNFLVWGLYHGVFLAIERVFPKFTDNIPSLFQHIYAITIVMIGWVVFRTESIFDSVAYLKAMFGASPIKSFAQNEVWFLSNGFVLPVTLIVAVLLSTPIFTYVNEKFNRYSLNGKVIPITFLLTFKNLYVLLLFFVCLMPLFGASYNAFIYFRF